MKPGKLTEIKRAVRKKNIKEENTKFRTAMTFLGHNCYSTTSKAKTVLQRVF